MPTDTFDSGEKYMVDLCGVAEVVLHDMTITRGTN
jgi:hypothetical protein